MRFYAKQRTTGETGGAYKNDDGEHKQAGFRFDHNFKRDNQLTFQGNIFRGEIGSLSTSDQPSGQEYHGGNVLMNWSFNETEKRRHEFQAFYDATDLKVPSLEDYRNTLDLSYQVQQNWKYSELVIGTGYRRVRDDVDSFFISPEHRTDETFNGFFQNDFAFLNKDLHFIIGTKYEYNDYTGSEWQPNVRLSYYVWDSLIWGSWSKAVRVPTRLETDITFPSLNGDQFDSETAAVYELGWRKRWSEFWQSDISLYHSEYDDLLSIEPDGLMNKLSGRTRGVEISTSFQPIKEWLLRVNYSHAEMDLESDADSSDNTTAKSHEGNLPQNMMQLVSMYDINSALQFNSYLRYVDSLRTNNIDNYLVADVSLRWALTDTLSANFTGRNLGDGSHEEWTSGVPVDDEYGVTVRWVMP